MHDNGGRNGPRLPLPFDHALQPGTARLAAGAVPPDRPWARSGGYGHGASALAAPELLYDLVVSGSNLTDAVKNGSVWYMETKDRTSASLLSIRARTHGP
ncbi:MAG: hypothetical protein R3E97_04830 [Candidatus Eisenbacteria bacterium]